MNGFYIGNGFWRYVSRLEFPMIEHFHREFWDFIETKTTNYDGIDSDLNSSHWFYHWTYIDFIIERKQNNRLEKYKIEQITCTGHLGFESKQKTKFSFLYIII